MRKYYSEAEIDTLVDRMHKPLQETGEEGGAEGEGGGALGLVGGVQDVPWERWSVEAAAEKNLVRSRLPRDPMMEAVAEWIGRMIGLPRSRF